MTAIFDPETLHLPSDSPSLGPTVTDETLIQTLTSELQDLNLDPDPDLKATDEVKADGWGWDQPEYETERAKEEGEAEGTDEDEKVEAFGWGEESRGNDDDDDESDKGPRKKVDAVFPVRPNEQDCAFYMKMGTCKYGLNCRFNHPANRTRSKGRGRKAPESYGQVVELTGSGMSSEMTGQAEHEKAHKDKKMVTYSESNGQVDCKYYSTPGGCKFGNACKYKHREKADDLAKLNFLGLPIRPGQKECTYYMRTGSCKYSTNCRFHHPDPIAVGGQHTSPGYQNGGSHAPAQLPIPSWPLQRTPNEPVPYLDASPPYVAGYYIPPQGLHPNPEWNSYQAPVNPLFPAQMNMPHPPSVATMKDPMHNGNASSTKKIPDGEYPERPGQPECQFFMKTGTCKFTAACKFHHPKSRLPKPSGVNVSPVGLPLRPDQPVCTHFKRHGICKYGSSCRYHHPTDYSSTVPSAAVVESAQKIFPETSVGYQEVKTKFSTDPIPDSEW